MNTMGKFGEFDIATNGIEVINSFSKAMNDNEYYGVKVQPFRKNSAPLSA